MRWLPLLILLLSGCGSLVDQLAERVAPTGPSTPVTQRQRLDIHQARPGLLGKKPADVIAVIGRPDRTSVSGEREWWMYYDRFNDPVAGVDLPNVTLRFRQGVVEAIAY